MGVHVEPLSRENSIEIWSGSLSASLAVHAIGTLPLVKSSPPAGLLIEAIGALAPALKLASVNVPVTRSIRATPESLGQVGGEEPDGFLSCRDAGARCGRRDCWDSDQTCGFTPQRSSSVLLASYSTS